MRTPISTGLADKLFLLIASYKRILFALAFLTSALSLSSTAQAVSFLQNGDFEQGFDLVTGDGFPSWTDRTVLDVDAIYNPSIAACGGFTSTLCGPAIAQRFNAISDAVNGVTHPGIWIPATVDPFHGSTSATCSTFGCEMFQSVTLPAGSFYLISFALKGATSANLGNVTVDNSSAGPGWHVYTFEIASVCPSFAPSCGGAMLIPSDFDPTIGFGFVVTPTGAPFDLTLGFAGGDNAGVDNVSVDSIVLLSRDTTPLPGAFPLFATGVGALGLLNWRRKRRQAA